MPLSDFIGIMQSIIGTPQNDVESTILYFISALLAVSIVMLVYNLFAIVGGLFKPR